MTTIVLKNFEFSPANIEIKAGQIVKFVNVEGSHTVTIIAPGREEPLIDVVLSKGDMILVKFNQPGSYNLICRFHENAGMIGKIIVGSP